MYPLVLLSVAFTLLPIPKVHAQGVLGHLQVHPFCQDICDVFPAVFVECTKLATDAAQAECLCKDENFMPLAKCGVCSSIFAVGQTTPSNPANQTVIDEFQSGLDMMKATCEGMGQTVQAIDMATVTFSRDDISSSLTASGPAATTTSGSNPTTQNGGTSTTTQNTSGTTSVPAPANSQTQGPNTAAGEKTSLPYLLFLGSVLLFPAALVL